MTLPGDSAGEAGRTSQKRNPPFVTVTPWIDLDILLGAIMTIDNSLKVKSGSSRVRNVLKRGERIEQMKQEGRWTEGAGALGLPKVRVQKIAMKKKKKVKKEEE